MIAWFLLGVVTALLVLCAISCSMLHDDAVQAKAEAVHRYAQGQQALESLQRTVDVLEHVAIGGNAQHQYVRAVVLDARRVLTTHGKPEVAPIERIASERGRSITHWPFNKDGKLNLFGERDGNA